MHIKDYFDFGYEIDKKFSKLMRSQVITLASLFIVIFLFS